MWVSFCSDFKSNKEDELKHGNITNDDDENPHLHLHLLTHPHQQAMHIRCTNQICSSCANPLTSDCGSVGMHLPAHAQSFSVFEMSDLREHVNAVGCKLHGQKTNTSDSNSPFTCHVHGTKTSGNYYSAKTDIQYFRYW